MHEGLPPSAWLQRFTGLLRPHGTVLDLACGSGRHVRWLTERGHAVTAVDRDAQALAPLAAIAETLVADLEDGPWPLTARQFDAVLVTNYLWRPLWPALLAALAPGGVLIYETFALGQQTVGRPARSEFLLRPGELLQVCAGLRVVAFEDGFEPGDAMHPPRFVQRIAAVSEAPEAAADALAPPRHGLTTG